MSRGGGPWCCAGVGQLHGFSSITIENSFLLLPSPERVSDLSYTTPYLRLLRFALWCYLSLSLDLGILISNCRPRSWLRVSQLSRSTRSFKLVLYPLTTTELLLFQIGFFC